MVSRLVRGIASAFLAACIGTAGAAEITVSAATSLTAAFKALAPLFVAGHPGTAVRLNFAASGALLQQIGAGRAGRCLRQC